MNRHNFAALAVATMLSLPAAGFSAPLYGVTNYYSNDPIGFCPNTPCPKLFNVNPTTGATAQIADIDTFYSIQDIAVSRHGPIYATGYQPDLEDSVLLRINRQTHATSVVGSSTPYAEGLEFDNKGRLFRYSTTQGLTRVNPTTGNATLIGGGPRDIGDLAFGNNRMYALQQRFEPIPGGGFSGHADLVTVNLHTGNTTTVGETALPFSYFPLAFKDNQLFSFLDGRFLSIDPTTGSTTALGTSAVDDFRAMGAAPVPLPAGAPLLVGALGLLGALGLRRRRWVAAVTA